MLCRSGLGQLYITLIDIALSSKVSTSENQNASDSLNYLVVEYCARGLSGWLAEDEVIAACLVCEKSMKTSDSENHRDNEDFVVHIKIIDPFHILVRYRLRSSLLGWQDATSARSVY